MSGPAEQIRHIGFNMWALLLVGRRLEPHLGRRRFTGLYIVTGLASSMVSCAWHWHAPAVSAGASGAIMGLIGAGVVVGQRVHTQAALAVRNRMLRWAIYTLLFGVMIHADNAGHLGGLGMGVLVGFAFSTPAANERPELSRTVAIGGVLPANAKCWSTCQNLGQLYADRSGAGAAPGTLALLASAGRKLARWTEGDARRRRAVLPVTTVPANPGPLGKLTE